MDIDLILAIGHHLAVFLLVAIFAAEFALLRPGLAGARVGQLARIDAAYGGVAALVIVVGVLRVIFGARCAVEHFTLFERLDQPLARSKPLVPRFVATILPLNPDATPVHRSPLGTHAGRDTELVRSWLTKAHPRIPRWRLPAAAGVIPSVKL